MGRIDVTLTPIEQPGIKTVRYVTAKRLEFHHALTETLDRLRAELYEIEKTLLRGNKKKRAPLVFWDPLILIGVPNDDQLLQHQFILTDGVYWNPLGGLVIHEEQAHPEVLKFFQTSYGDQCRYIRKE